MRSVCILLALALTFSICAAADTVETVYRFDEPKIAANGDGSVAVTMSGTWNRAIAGRPVLPAKTARVLIPQGHRVVSARVEVPYWIDLTAGHVVEHGPRSRTYSGDAPGDFAPPAVADETIYGSKAPYPAAPLVTVGTQKKRGASIFVANLFPVSYTPYSGGLRYAPAMELLVETEPDAKASVTGLPYRALPADNAAIARNVDNPALLTRYARTAKEPADGVDYLIIVPAALEAAVQPYAEYKTNMWGLAVQVVTLEWIEDNAAGADAAEKMRNHIVALFKGSGLQYVLLVGDADGQGNETLPMRKLWVTGSDPDGPTVYTDTNMASDLYFACLDGPYNFDGDAFWGEPEDGVEGGDVDLLADVHVGRFPVDTEAELNNMISKTVSFESNEAPWAALFVGEILDSISTGGDHKDVVASYMGGVPVTTLYERDGTYSYAELVTAINSNQYQWLNHAGHANVTFNMDFFSGSVGALSNSSYYLGFTHGCYCGSIDGRDSYGFYSSSDCVIEWFTAKHGAGAFAYLANTRYGFYLTGRTDGPSNVYDWEFADALVNEEIKPLGAAADDAKEDCVGMLDPLTMMRWCYYELMLFGDPHTPMQFVCDEDGDGEASLRCGGTDCDDHDPATYAGAPEACDGIDNNCDDLVPPDEADKDADGVMVCGGDCNDADAGVGPDMTEICDDTIDNDCNQLTDLDDPACAPPGDDDDDASDDDTGDGDSSGDDDDDDDTGCGN